MHAISHSDVMQLVEAPGDRFVSLYLPTHPAGREAPQNPIRFREQLNTAADVLRKKGMNASEVQDFLASASDLLHQPLLWHSLSRGLAVLISTGDMRVWQLPFQCDELCVVGKQFHVAPFIAWLNEDAPYYILAVSQNHVRLLHGARYKIQDVEIPNLPTCRIEALHYHPSERSLQSHSGQPHRGKEGRVFTGQGGDEDVAKEDIAAYFRMIDVAVSHCLHERTEPLVFAGVDYLYPIYRGHNHYPHLLPTHISGNPDLSSPADLRESAWPLVASALELRQKAEIEKYWNLVKQGRGSNRVEEIIKAAYEGAVETLFIFSKVQWLGCFDPHLNMVRIDEYPRHDSEDLVNLAVCLVLKHRGNVEAVMSGNIPGGGPMAAIFRYAPVTAPG